MKPVLLPLVTAIALFLGAAVAPSDGLAKETDASGATRTAPLQQGATLDSAPPVKAEANGGTSASAEEVPTEPEEPQASEEAAPAPEAVAPASGGAAEALAIPSLPSSSCAASGVPPALIPIYQGASAEHGLGPQGPAILAGINAVETNFGTNLGPSSAGALGWMQFMPATWEMYGVDANGDGVNDPNNPEDAIYAAAGYLSASGMPADTYGAIFAYNHAAWYVEEVLANAGCYASEVGSAAFSAAGLGPQIEVLHCEPTRAWKNGIPAAYLSAFEDAAARYQLGKRGVWALAAIARLESNFGRGMNEVQLGEQGPLGLDETEWRKYAVDGDGDGRIRHADPADSAATLARSIWSRGDLEAGIFAHNQAEWYVQEVLRQADEIEGGCKVRYVDWRVAPLQGSLLIDWSKLTLSNELERQDIVGGALDPRILALLAAITQRHQLTITALRSDHSELTTSGNVSNHFFGRAMDIAAVDGVSCTETSPSGPCAELGYELASLEPSLHPTELIYCFDLDGSGPAFALPDHCDHVHAGFDG